MTEQASLTEQIIRPSVEEIHASIPHPENRNAPVLEEHHQGQAQEGTLEVTYRTAPQIGSASGAAERVEVERLNSPEVRGL
jgi:hypothetical protein